MMKNKKKFKEEVLFILALALPAFGAFFSVPARGLVATLPVFLLSALLSAVLRREIVFTVPVSVCSAFLSALFSGVGVRDSVIFAVFCGMQMALAHFCVVLFVKKKPVFRLAGVLLLLCGILLGFFVVGTPWRNAKARRETEAFLQAQYPNEKFGKVLCRLDPVSRKMLSFASLATADGGKYSLSVVQEGEEPDGYYTLLSDFAGQKGRGLILEALREGTEKEFTVSDPTFPADDKNTPVQSTLENISDEEFLSHAHFAVAFRNVSKKRDFAVLCEEALVLLRQSGAPFETVEFQGLAGEKVRFTCTIDQNTKPEDIASLCRSAVQENPLL